MFGRTIGTRPMPFHATFMAIILVALRRCILYVLSIFLFHLDIIPLMMVP